MHVILTKINSIEKKYTLFDRVNTYKIPEDKF